MTPLDVGAHVCNVDRFVAVNAVVSEFLLMLHQIMLLEGRIAAQNLKYKATRKFRLSFPVISLSHLVAF